MKVFFGRNLKDLFYLFILILFIIIFYSSFLAGKSFIWEDALYIFYPGTNYFISSLLSGRWPLWINGLRCGMPFYSDVQMGIYNPITYLLIFFTSNGNLNFLAYQIFLVLNILMGAFFTYFLLKDYKLESISSVVGATIFAFSGFISLHIIHQNFLNSIIWLPLLLLILKKKFETGKNVYYFYLIFGILISLLQGGPQIPLYFNYFLILYWLYLLSNEKTSDRKQKIKLFLLEFLKIFLVYASVIILGAIFFFPAIQNWYYSSRESFGFKEIADQSLPIFHLIQFFAPNFFGFVNGSQGKIPFWGFNKDTIEYQTWHTGGWQYWEFGFYAGQIVLVSLFIIIFNWKNVKEEKKYPFMFFLFSSIIALWIMLGRYGGLFNILYWIAPGFSMFRTPARMACVLDFLLALISAGILDLVIKEKSLCLKKPFLANLIVYVILILFITIFGSTLFTELKEVKNFNNSIGQLLTGLFISSFIWCLLLLLNLKKTLNLTLKNILKFCLVGIVFFDLYSAYSHFHKGKVSPEKYYSDKNNLIKNLSNLRKNLGPFRFAQLINSKVSEEIIFPRNMSYFYPDYEVLEGYVLYYLKNYLQLSKLNDKARIDLLNVKVFANYDSSLNQIGVFLYTNSLPRAVFYSKVKSFNNDEEIINSINTGDLNYFQEIGITSNYFNKYNFFSNSSNYFKEVKVSYLNPEKIKIDYDVPSSGIIFVSQTYYPGWKTEKEKFDVIPVFGGLTGIVIPAKSKGEIQLVFKPQIFYISSLISICSFICLLSLLIFTKVKEKETKASLNRKLS